MNEKTNNNKFYEKKNLLILGAGYFTYEIFELAKETEKFNVIGFVEGLDKNRCSNKINGLPVFWINDIKVAADNLKCICAIGSNKRQNIIKQTTEKGYTFTNLIHPGAEIYSSVKLNNGIIIGPGSIISAETTIGNHVIINRGCLIGHHVKLGNFVTISPGSNIAGRVSIGNGAFIGMGSIILDGISIGHNSIIGAGSVVTKDVPPNVQVLGIPAKITKTLI